MHNEGDKSLLICDIMIIV